MTTTDTQRFWQTQSWQQRVLPGVWIVAYAAAFVALPWWLATILVIPVGLRALGELGQIRLNWPGHNSSRLAADFYLELVYTCGPMAILSYVHKRYGRGMVAYLILLAFTSDTAAFYAGRAFGRIRFAPRISPNKSLEGVGFGVLAAVCAGLVIRAMGAIGAGYVQVVWVSALLALVGVAGDLVESAIKRRAVPGCKDSGTILRGHGGVLDRIDALIAICFVAGLLLSLGILH
jgi:phosphatidate cytidylyltransferase